MEKKTLGRYRYTLPDYKLNQKVDLTGFLNDLHQIQMDCIDEALEKSNLKEANEVIARIKSKLSCNGK